MPNPFDCACFTSSTTQLFNWVSEYSESRGGSLKACPTEVSEHNRCQQIKQSSNLQVLQRRGVQNLISFPAKILGSVKRSSLPTNLVLSTCLRVNYFFLKYDSLKCSWLKVTSFLWSEVFPLCVSTSSFFKSVVWLKTANFSLLIEWQDFLT